MGKLGENLGNQYEPLTVSKDLLGHSLEIGLQGDEVEKDSSILYVKTQIVNPRKRFFQCLLEGILSKTPGDEELGRGKEIQTSELSKEKERELMFDAFIKMAKTQGYLRKKPAEEHLAVNQQTEKVEDIVAPELIDTIETYDDFLKVIAEQKNYL